MKSSVLLDDGGSGKWLCLRTGSESADDDGGAPAAAERCSKAKIPVESSPGYGQTRQDLDRLDQI